MRKKYFFISLTFLFFSYLSLIPPHDRHFSKGSGSCSTFVLKHGDHFIVGHNMDMPMAIPGILVINKRNVFKKGIAWEQLASWKTIRSPEISWTSKYGSVTFNPQGREFPDGGMNEAGLTITETSLPGTQNIKDESLPKLFTMQWMQYVLDNFAAVEEALESASEIALDGADWDYCVTDRAGKIAILEFHQGKPVVYTGDTMPIPVQTNTKYTEELENLKSYSEFGGEIPISMEDRNISRFVQAALMLRPHSFPSSESIIGYGFDILRQMERGHTQWSIVFDVKNMGFYFRTSQASKIRHLHFDSFDFSPGTPVKIVDINADLSEYVSRNFADYTFKFNRCMIEKLFGVLSKDDPQTMEEFLASGISLEVLIDRIARYPETTVIKKWR